MISKNIHVQNFMKIRWVGVELSQADGRTETYDEDNCRFSQFCDNE